MIPKPLRRPRLALAAAGAVVAAAAIALPSAAAPDFKSVFTRLDANKDGVLTAEEFMASAGGGDTKTENVVVMHSRTEKKDGDAPAPALKPELKEEAFTFWLGDGVDKAPGDVTQHRYQVIERREVRTTDGQPPTTQTTVITHDDIRKREFASFDTDKDGKVSFSEFEARQKAMLTRGFELLDADGDKSLTEAEYAKVGGPLILPDLGPDTPKVDLPGKISAEQLKANFTKMDKDGNGRVSLQEYLPST